MSGYCVAYSYNAADQLTVWPGMHSYEYDDNGALRAVMTADGQTEQQTFTYHPNGLMNTATFNNQTQTLTNHWDADEHRVQLFENPAHGVIARGLFLCTRNSP